MHVLRPTFCTSPLRFTIAGNDASLFSRRVNRFSYEVHGKLSPTIGLWEVYRYRHAQAEMRCCFGTLCAAMVAVFNTTCDSKGTGKAV